MYIFPDVPWYVAFCPLTASALAYSANENSDGPSSISGSLTRG
jgi:hypothetical protein